MEMSYVFECETMRNPIDFHRLCFCLLEGIYIRNIYVSNLSSPLISHDIVIIITFEAWRMGLGFAGLCFIVTLKRVAWAALHA